LRNRSYEFADDDFIGREKWEPLMPLVKFLKVDYRECGESAQLAIAQLYLPRKISLVAEKVEIEDELKRSRKLGCTFFQRCFFSKPTMMSDRDISAGKTVCIKLIREITLPELNIPPLRTSSSASLQFTYKLLRYINSPPSGVTGEGYLKSE